MSALLTLEEAQARLLALAPQTYTYTFGLSQVAGNAYTYAAQCDIPNVGKTRSVSLLTRQSESAYTVKVDSEGEINGKPMKTSELLSAKRVGNCKVPKTR